MDGERLQELRKDSGLKQEELAKALGVSLSSVKAYEQGRSNPDDAVKVRIAQFFNISLDYLLGAIDDELPLKRSDAINLPKGFPIEAVSDLKDYMKFLETKHGNDNKPR